MTPSLSGRIQTRLLLFLVLGLPITLFWSWYLAVRPATLAATPFLVILSILIVGLLLDPIYIQSQRYRWDRDWPFAYQLASMIFEFLIVLLLIASNILPFLPSSLLAPPNALTNIVLHFTSVLVPSFLSLLGFVQIFFLRWKYDAGELTG